MKNDFGKLTPFTLDYFEITLLFKMRLSMVVITKIVF